SRSRASAAGWACGRGWRGRMASRPVSRSGPTMPGFEWSRGSTRPCSKPSCERSNPEQPPSFVRAAAAVAAAASALAVAALARWQTGRVRFRPVAVMAVLVGFGQHELAVDALVAVRAQSQGHGVDGAATLATVKRPPRKQPTLEQGHALARR